MITRSLTLITLAILLLDVPASRAASPFAQMPPPAGFIITNVRVFDGDGVHERTQVAVEGGIIRAVGPELATWRHLPAIDGSGTTLIPGLIDAHAHVRNLEDLADALRFGVTTVLDLGASGVTPSQQSELRATAARRMDVADLRYAGYVATAPGGHGTELRNARLPNPPTVERAADAVSFVAARKAEGSDYLKIAINGVRTADQGMPTLDEARVRALVDAAHQRGMLTIAHIETVGDTEIALASGVDSLAHVWRRGGANLDLARQVAARRVPVTLTLAIPDGRLPASRESLLLDGRLRPFMSPRIVQQLSQTVNPPAQANLDPRRIFDLHVEAARSLHTADARLMVGTDAAMANDTVQHSNPTVHGISVHRELELLVTEIGLSPVQALAAATTNPAQAFRLTDRGRIEVGRKGDLVLVRGNPTVNITATRDILRVWRSGVELTRTVHAR